MRIDELEDMMTEEPGEAEAAIAELVSNSRVEHLANIAKHGRVLDLELRAIEGLGEVGGPEATGALIEILETVNTPFVIGGTEQEMAHAARRAGLVQAVARARAVPPPSAQTQEAIAEFIESVRRG
jgi:hypothetical protein